MEARTYELRSCWRCWRGLVYRPPTLTDPRGGWKPCPECSGSGEAMTYIYPTKRGRRGA